MIRTTIDKSIIIDLFMCILMQKLSILAKLGGIFGSLLYLLNNKSKIYYTNLLISIFLKVAF
jgi:hypothetical protein